MNDNSMATIILCSHLCLSDDIKPFEPSEWTTLAQKLIDNNVTPANLLNFSDTDFNKYFNEDEILRIKKLLSRSGSISFALNEYRQQGINIITRADNNYPKILKSKLLKRCPPLFYYVGDLSICNKPSIGFVGSRKIDSVDVDYTNKTVLTAINNNYAIVSGGAKGVDSISVETAINNNGYAIEYVADSLQKKIRQKSTIQALRNNKLVILSLAKPDAGFNTGLSMARNKFIYAQSDATVVIRSEFNKGGTWNGATEALKNSYCTLLCYDKNYSGNKALIEKGAIPISESWNGDFRKTNKNLEEITLFNFNNINQST